MEEQKQKIRIMTWNLGQFIWMRLVGRLFPIHGNKNRYQNYNKGNSQVIKNIISEIKPDIFIAQELEKNTVISDFWEGDESIHFSPSYYRHFQKLYIGKEKGKSVFLKNHKELTIIELEKFIIFSVHLNAFSAKKRYEEINSICDLSKSYEKPIICLGDFNLWKRGDLFLFKYDYLAYKKISQYFNYATRDISYTTPIGFSLDNIFTKKITIKNAGIIYENGLYMDHYPIYLDFEI